MKIKISFLSQLKRAAGTSCIAINADAGKTIQDILLNQVCPKLEGLSRTILDEHGALHQVLLIFVEDEQIDIKKPYIIKDSINITLMFPIAGG